jgi:hypothetical protein
MHWAACAGLDEHGHFGDNKQSDGYIMARTGERVRGEL